MPRIYKRLEQSSTHLPNVVTYKIHDLLVTSFEMEKALKEVHGRDIGVLVIGPRGENMVRYATVISERTSWWKTWNDAHLGALKMLRL